MKKFLFVLSIVTVSILGLVSPASASTLVPPPYTLTNAAFNPLIFCHGGDCNVGKIEIDLWIEQARDANATQNVYGTKAFCRITALKNVIRVRIGRCALGIVGGIGLSSYEVDTVSTLQATTYSPNPQRFTYNATRHFSTTNGFNIWSAGQFSVRWLDNQTTDINANSLQSNDYECVGPNFPCTSVFTTQ